MNYELVYYCILGISQFWMINEKESDIFSKVKNRVIWPRNCTSSIIPKRNKNISESKSMYTNAHSSIIYDSQRWKQPKYPTTDEWIHYYCSISTHAVCVLNSFSCVWLFVTLWTVACQALLFMGFSRQEYWSKLVCPPPGNIPDQGSHPFLLCLLY